VSGGGGYMYGLERSLKYYGTLAVRRIFMYIAEGFVFSLLLYFLCVMEDKGYEGFIFISAMIVFCGCIMVFNESFGGVSMYMNMTLASGSTRKNTIIGAVLFQVIIVLFMTALIAVLAVAGNTQHMLWFIPCVLADSGFGIISAVIRSRSAKVGIIVGIWLMVSITIFEYVLVFTSQIKTKVEGLEILVLAGSMVVGFAVFVIAQMILVTSYKKAQVRI
jgi:hypothetical protein